MNIGWRYALLVDAPFLAEWNDQLIRDEGHRNAMNLSELTVRMRGWLEHDYKAVIFSVQDIPVGYALYRQDSERVYLRQFFVVREKRRQGLGRKCFKVLRHEIWPKNLQITVDVLCQNTPAVAFWRAMGYVDYCLTLEIRPEIGTQIPPKRGE
jgi:predicted acetyltransferase